MTRQPRSVDAQRLGGLEVEDELKLGCLHRRVGVSAAALLLQGTRASTHGALTPRPGRREKNNEAPSWSCAFSFVAASHRCAMPIARSAPAVASATEIARAKRSIFRSSHRDIAHSPAPGPHFSAARFGVRPLQTRAPLRAGLRIRGLTVQLQ